MSKTKVVISRKKWARGRSSGGNKLLLTKEDVRVKAGCNNSTLRAGNMCCLGFASLAAGATKSAIRGQAMPNDVYDRSRKRAIPGLSKIVMHKSRYEGGTYPVLHNTAFSVRASKVNDSPTLSDKVKEQRLRKLASRNGFTFKFVA